MHMKKVCFGILIFCILFSGCTQREKTDTEKEIKSGSNSGVSLSAEETSIKIGENLPVSRALAAKMICLAYEEKADISIMDKVINFTDVERESWYYPYINCACTRGYMSGGGETFRPLEPLSLYEAQVLIDRLNPGNKTKIKITEETRNKPISYSLWINLFQKALSEANGGKGLGEISGITEGSLILFATPSNASLNAWTMATDKGIYSFSGYSMDAYIDKKIRVLCKGDEIVGLLEIVEERPVLKNAYLREWRDKELTVFVGGAERKIILEEDISESLPAIGDIKLNQGKAEGVSVTGEFTTGVIKKSNGAGIELEGKGFLETEEDFKVYTETENSASWSGRRNLICGSDIADFYTRDGKICAAVIRREAKPDTVRVVLSTTGFGGYIHKGVSISCDMPFTVKAGDSETEYGAGEGVSFEMGDAFPAGSRVYIRPSSENGKIRLMSVEKANGMIPEYEGILEIEKREDGFVLVNEIDMERYLYGVVPSEMPSGYGLEASKVQAVTARSYGYNQFYANKYYEYGANVDDSTMCQVYNNTGYSQTAKDAVDSTKGLCMTYGGEVISANFFSTSAGTTANSGEVWANSATKSFPSVTQPYLKSCREYEGADYGDLSKEENATAFLKDVSLDAFDKDASWFRWSVEFTKEEITAVVDANLKTVYSRSPYLVKTLQKDGSFKSKPIESVGPVEDIIVNRRGGGGNVMEILVKGQSAQVLVLTEYNIRTLLSPVQKIAGADPITVNCHTGDKYKNYSMLPSAFFTIDKKNVENGVVSTYLFYGGGNGHGVGMSQNGVKGMVDKGYGFEDILKYYYNGVEIEQKI